MNYVTDTSTNAPVLNMIETAQQMEERCGSFPWFRGIGCGMTKRGRVVFIYVTDVTAARAEIVKMFPGSETSKHCRVEFHLTMGL